MAFMIPETIDDIYNVTIGEKKVFKLLRIYYLIAILCGMNL